MGGATATLWGWGKWVHRRRTKNGIVTPWFHSAGEISRSILPGAEHCGGTGADGGGRTRKAEAEGF